MGRGEGERGATASDRGRAVGGEDEPRAWIASPAQGVFAAAAVGGKGAALFASAAAGFPVPPFVCVTTRAFRDLRARAGAALADPLRELEDLSRAEASGARGGDERIPGIAAAAREAVRGAGLADAARDAIDTAVEAHIGAAEVAVRSSAVGEDSATDSFAGQMDTYLYVSRGEVADRVLDCLASAYSERALYYRRTRGAGAGAIEAGVVIQAMIPARAAGVAFSANPATGDPTEVVITAGLGLGEGVVSDRVPADAYYVSAPTGEKGEGRLTAHIADKSTRVVRDAGASGGTRAERVPESERSAPSLSEREARAVAALARRAENRAGSPQDVEWAVDARGDLWLLQARPITALSAGRASVFESSNIVESYPGLSSPLTFSYVRRAYAETFREAARRFGVPAGALRREADALENLVALVDGRIYYNILNWYRLYELAGFRRATAAWERAMGLSEPARRGGGEGRLTASRRLQIAGHIAAQFWLRSRDAARYWRALEAARAELEATDLDSLSGHELVERLEGLMDRLLAPYAVAVVNDFYAQQLHDLARRLLARWLGGPRDGAREGEGPASGAGASGHDLANALLSGDTDMESVRPVASLLALAREIRGDRGLSALFSGQRSEPEIWRALTEDPAYAGFAGRLREHLDRYGDRTASELKLETPSLRDDPTYALRMLRAYADSGRDLTTEDTGRRRRRAEEAMAARLRGRPLRRALLSRVLAAAREAVSARESLRLARSLGVGMVKRLFRALGRRLAAEGALRDAGEIFYLTVDEVFGAVRGHAVTRDVDALAALRRREYERFAAMEAPPPRIVTRGIVAAKAFSRAGAGGGSSAAPAGGGGGAVAGADRGGAAGELVGQGSSPGRARGAAVVADSPEEAGDVTGKILVAPATDPGWVFTMVAAEGLVVEKGNLLSHAAIVGRELGVPTVVGAEGATRRISTGDDIEIDGAAGIVRIAPAAAAAGGAGGGGRAEAARAPSAAEEDKP